MITPNQSLLAVPGWKTFFIFFRLFCFFSSHTKSPDLLDVTLLPASSSAENRTRMIPPRALRGYFPFYFFSPPPPGGVYVVSSTYCTTFRDVW